MSPIYKHENLRVLRKHLRLTQKEFIGCFLEEENKNPMSVASYSNLEAKGSAKLKDVILKVASKLSLDPMIFSMDPAEFAQKLTVLLPDSTETQLDQCKSPKKSGIAQLINQLTFYFAEQIFEKKLKRGDKIESDRELANRFQVGRSTVREAMKVLDVLGLVDIHPGQGTYISKNESQFFVIPLSWSLFLNGGQVDDIIAVRNLLEVKAARLASGCADEKCMQMLSDITHRMNCAYIEKNYREFWDYDIKFHTCIAKASGNEVLYNMVETISNLMKHISQTGMIYEEQLKEIYEEHQKIYGSILTHNEKEAEQAMEYHLRKSKDRYNYR